MGGSKPVKLLFSLAFLSFSHSEKGGCCDGEETVKGTGSGSRRMVSGFERCLEYPSASKMLSVFWIFLFLDLGSTQCFVVLAGLPELHMENPDLSGDWALK